MMEDEGMSETVCIANVLKSLELFDPYDVHFLSFSLTKKAFRARLVKY